VHRNLLGMAATSLETRYPKSRFDLTIPTFEFGLAVEALVRGVGTSSVREAD
jgi:hypothetical protein